MNTFLNAAAREMASLEREIRNGHRSKKGKGTGCLQSRTVNGKKYYYRQHNTKDKRMTKYLGTAGSAAVARFIIEKVNVQRLKVLEKDKKLLADMLSRYEQWDTDAILSSMHPNYLKAFHECKLTDIKNMRTDAASFGSHEKLWKWASSEYQHNSIEMTNPTRTLDGSLVRSKGECIWYNALRSAGLPFRYECVLTLIDQAGNERQIYPDFMLLDAEEKLILIEHLGMLLEPDYRKNFGNKLALYMFNGYVPGDNLIITCDAPDHSINSEVISELIEGRLKKLVFGR